MTLTEFLLARIGEDEGEASAHAVLRVDPTDGMPRYQGIPARVLAECDAKRRIVMDYRKCDQEAAEFPSGYWAEALQDALRLLALPYADHPDYLAAWRQ